MADLRAQVVSAAKWSALSEAMTKAVTPAVFVVLARLLTPEDFGIVAVATIVISFSTVFWDAGLGKALIQRRGAEDELERAANVVFWSNVALSLVIYGLLLTAADTIAAGFGDPRVAPVVRVQGLQILLGGLSSVHVALHQRALDFRSLFWVRLSTIGMPGLASIPLAWLGYGYWALVAGSLLGALAQLVILWCKSSWRPRLRYEGALARQLARFGLWAGAEGLLAWAYIWVDAIIVGLYLSSHDLGLYRVGNTFLGAVFGLLLGPVLPVLFSSFTRLQHDREALLAALLKTNKLLAMLALPLGVGVFLLAAPLADVVFDAAWPGIAPVLAMLGLTQAVAWLFGANEQAYRAMGRPDINPKVVASWLVLYIPAYLLAAPHGLLVFLWTRLAVEVMAQPLVLIVAHRVLGISALAAIRQYRWVLAAVLVMAAAVAGLDLVLPAWQHASLRIGVLVAVGAAVYGAVICAAEGAFVRSVLALLPFGSRLVGG